MRPNTNYPTNPANPADHSQVVPNGGVVCTDYPRSHIEIRSTIQFFDDNTGSQCGRIELKFKDGHNRLLLECGRMSVPTSMIVLSHVSGPLCAQVMQEVRRGGAKVEAPDHVMQLGQLKSAHATWLQDSTLDPNLDEIVGPINPVRRVEVPVPSHDHNMRVIWDSQLRCGAMEAVPTGALGSGTHDLEHARAAVMLAPALGMPEQVIQAANLPQSLVDAPPPTMYQPVPVKSPPPVLIVTS